MRLVSEKMEDLYAEHNERLEAATSILVTILEQENFYNIFILCLWIRIFGRSDQGVKFMNFFFTDTFFNSVIYGCDFLLLL